jgi:hypothetical protein
MGWREGGYERCRADMIGGGSDRGGSREDGQGLRRCCSGVCMWRYGWEGIVWRVESAEMMLG